MSSPKAQAMLMIERLPDDASLEDIQYHMYVLQKINHGIQRAETEGAISHPETKARLGRWLLP